MTALIAAALLGALPLESAEDYFPLVKGTTWTYQDVTDTTSVIEHDSVGNVQKVGDQTATLIVTKIDGKVDGSTFYRVEGDQVLVVAFDQNKPLQAPYPILKMPSTRNSWEFTGATQWQGDPVPLTVKGSVKRIGGREFFGLKRDCLEVTLDAVVGPDKTGVRERQVYVYAKGIGIVEQRDTIRINKTKTERVRKLIDFKLGKQD